MRNSWGGSPHLELSSGHMSHHDQEVITPLTQSWPPGYSVFDGLEPPNCARVALRKSEHVRRRREQPEAP